MVVVVEGGAWRCKLRESERIQSFVRVYDEAPRGLPLATEKEEKNGCINRLGITEWRSGLDQTR
jgi:hypothetical protein